jgi:DNA-binding transcriptional MocR family regulator
MSLKAINWVWDHSESRGSRRLVLLALADYADNANQCYPSARTLAKKSKISEMTVHRAIRELSEIGEITVLRRKMDGRQGNEHNLYTMPLKQYPAAKSEPSPAPLKKSKPPEIPEKLKKMARWQLVAEMKAVNERLAKLQQPGDLVRTPAGWVKPAISDETREAIAMLRYDLLQLQAAFDGQYY